jgi:phospholipid transport system substrate-binding protein
MPALRLRAATTACALLTLATVARADDPPATKRIAHLNAVLLEVLQHAETLGYQGRLDKIAPAVDETFDVAFMAEKSIGRHWKPLSEADRTRWVALFREFMAANYAGNFNRFAGQRFEISGEEPSQNDTTIVHSKLFDPAGEDTELNYRFHDTPAGPKVVDVYLKGTVSQLALQRSDYTSVLERGGLEALMTSVRGKIADLAAGRAKRQSG